MTPVRSVLSGVVRGFWVGPRALWIKLLTSEGDRLLVEVGLSRPDFLAQLELVKYALGANEEQEVREANGFEPLPPKQLWVMAAASRLLPPEDDDASLGHPATAAPSADAPEACRTIRARALGLGGADINPFDVGLEGF